MILNILFRFSDRLSDRLDVELERRQENNVFGLSNLLKWEKTEGGDLELELSDAQF